jgi:hypothetical protein
MRKVGKILLQYRDFSHKKRTRVLLAHNLEVSTIKTAGI